jgi:thioredoxin reductase (NADPH)
VAEIQIYGASWCPDCRRAKRFLSDQRIAFGWHDVDQEPAGLNVVHERNNGNNVIPTIVFPDGSHLSEPTNEELANKLGLSRMAMMHVYDLVVIGGGPTGLTTSIYAARENLQTLIVDSKGLGGQAGVTERLDNYPGFPEGVGGAELADRIVQQARRYGVEMLQAVSVTQITGDGDQVDVETATGDHYHARAALIATGSSYRRTNAPGEDDLIGAGIHFCATCDGPFYKGSEQLVVLGGGNSGLEEGLFLTQFTNRVTIVERGDRLRGNKVLQDKIAMHPKMEVLLKHAVESFTPKADGSGKLGAVAVKDLETGESRELQPAGVFVFIGLDPNTDVVKG